MVKGSVNQNLKKYFVITVLDYNTGTKYDQSSVYCQLMPSPPNYEEYINHTYS